ncbi:hypothetical protein Aperf_G00000030148 [Anoplocephala perfoliata]
MDGLSLEETLSNVDTNLFRQFREKTSDLKDEKLGKDPYVARWLKARNWDVDKAEKMFRLNLEWRSENKLDDLLTSFIMPEVIEKYFPGGICGQDKFGRPAFICPAGTIDVFGLMRSVSKTQLALSRYYLMEKFTNEVLPAQARKMGKPIDQLVVVFDLQHVNRRLLWRPWLNFFLEMASTFEINYPELMAACFVLNAPSFFSMIYSLLKPLLSKETQDKIHILGSNYHDELLKLFNPEGLPAHYGGTMRDPDGDPRCPSRICWGGTIPESYYQIQQTSTSDEVDEGFQLVPVGRGSKEYCYIGEAKSGDTVSWEFYSEANDIAFSLWIEPPNESNSPLGENSRRRSAKWRGQNGGGSGNSGMTTSFSFNNLINGAGVGGNGKLDLKQVIQPVRVDCDLVPEVGEQKVEADGNYYLLFDNSYSWTRPKRIFCKAEVRRSVCPVPTTTTTISAPLTAADDNSNNKLDLEEEGDASVLAEIQRAVDVELSEVMKAVCDPGYSSISTIDIDVTALAMVLLRTLPIIRRQFRTSERSSPDQSPSPSFLKLKAKRPIKMFV